jgi:hypothetical protein
MTGTLRHHSNRWLVRDEITNVEAELRGASPAPLLGQRVEVTGAASAASGRNGQVIEVARLVPAGQGGAARPTGQPGSSKPGSSSPQRTGGQGGGMSSGAKVALIVAIAGGAGAGVVFATMSR